ncbi:T9SS sorting signal type C domain-containing protein [Flavobacterium sp. Sd200]|uniref:GEVED domain-containing protein n=1 Tax=Flavobacterium sp. Sd200 TaxID=2692211 RepID=UPI00136F9D56|nr:GEVED domain-containing protein [Flavobacterium sp. Sd200]MXN90698.1 T9SS sorting signal type C domain-containing protein [Flavobacterium sp. Sd200]
MKKYYFKSVMSNAVSGAQRRSLYIKKGLFAAAALLLLNGGAAFAQEYCVPAPTGISGTGITNFTFGTINNTTGAETGNYGDYTNQVANVGQTVTQPFTITMATTIGYGVKVWVDWNNDFDFDDEGEQVYSTTTSSNPAVTLNGSLTVPANAAIGPHRLRVGGALLGRGGSQTTPCFNGTSGAYEDYTLNVTPPPTCFAPVNLIVTNVSSGRVNISWGAPTLGNAPQGYEYAIVDSPAQPVSGVSVSGTSASNLECPLNGYLYVRSNCGNGDYSQWASVSFYNGYCTPQPTYIDGQGITNVTIGSINNTTAAETGNYGNYTAQTVNVGQGVTQPFSITLTTGLAFNTRIWIDWNNDLDFDDAGEQVYDATSAVAATATLTGTFTVPANALLGNHRLRVGSVVTWSAPVTACTSLYNASYEDYTINVTNPPSCFTPTAPTGTSVASGIANISWTAPTLGNTPTGYEYAVTNSATPPATGTPNATTTVNNVTVTANAVNYIHVRAICGNNNYSEWFTGTYFNGYCTPRPTSIEGNGITNVTFGGINNTTTTEDNNYGDFTAQIANIGQGVTTPFSLTLNVPQSYNVKIWVDWNNDLDFNDPGEELYSGASAAGEETSTITGYLTVPFDTVLGNHRVRVGAVVNWLSNISACYTGEYGSYEDYTLNVTTPPSCFTPTNVAGQITSAGVNSLSWTAPQHGTTPDGYQYAVTETSATPATGTDVTATTVNGINVPVNAVSYLHVRTNCGNGDFSEWVTIPFYNGVCIPTPNYVNGQGITNVTIGSINNTTVREDDEFGDYTDQVVNIGQGVSQPFSIGLNVYVRYNVRIWIDLNDDLDFTDEGEQVYAGISEATETTVLSGNINIPITAPLGNHRLRIGITPMDNEVPQPCGYMTNGAYEDYTVNVTTPPSCFTPSAPAGVATTANTANLSWTAPTLGNTPAGYQYAVTTSNTPPDSGTNTTGTSVTGFTGITNNTYYYLHVRTDCGDGDYSLWVTSLRFRYLEGDTCATAIDLTNQSSPYSFSTQGAEHNFSPECYSDHTAPDLFYTIDVPNGYTLSIRMTEPGYDAVHSVFYGGCAANEQTFLTCTDDDFEETVWENRTGSTQTVYWVQDGWSTASGNFTLEWSFTPPPACDVPRLLDADITSLTSTNVSWALPNTGTPVGYEYAVTNSQTPPASGEYTAAFSASGIAITPNVLTYLHVRSVCGEDGFSEWATYEFFSGYCVPTNNESTEFYISGITTEGGETNISNTGTGFSGYTDYTATHSVTTYAGGAFTITATHPGEEYLYTVWIDWNNNFDFSDDGERVINSPYLASPAQVGTVTVPVGVAEGTYRMRIRNARLGSPIPVCGEQGAGEAEDYTVIVTAAPSCFAPYGLSIEPVDASTANLRWSPPELGTFPQGYEYVLSNTSAEPTGSGTPTTSIFIDSAPYNPAVSNYLFVRSNCGDGGFSEWVSTSILDTDHPLSLENSVTVFKEGSSINIASGNILITGVNVYDVRGSKLYTQSDINDTKAAINGLQIQQQVVIVEINTAKGKVSKRIVY